MLKNLVLFCVLFGLAAEFLHAQITEAEGMNGPRDEIKHRRFFGWRKNYKDRPCPLSNFPCKSDEECLRDCDKSLHCKKPPGCTIRRCLLDDEDREPFS